jgi:hypothetical protein
VAGPDAPPRLRPLEFGEVLDAAFKVCTRHWKALLLSVLFVVVPLQLLSLVVTLSTIEDFEVTVFDIGSGTASSPDDPDAGTVLAGQLVALLLSMAMFVLAQGACFRAIAEGWLGGRPTWQDSLRFALRLALPLLWVTVLYFLAIMLGVVALLVGAIWATVAFAFCYPALLVEDLRGTEALGRSRRLVSGQWWRCFGILLIGFLLATAISLLATIVVSLPIVFVDGSSIAALIVSAVAAIVAAAISTPLQAAITTILYFDLRVRKEGLDLELLAQRIGAPAPVAGAAPAAAPAAPQAPAGPLVSPERP